jgi:hypothetical protein
LGCPRHVRVTPDRDRGEDIPDRRLRAKDGSCAWLVTRPAALLKVGRIRPLPLQTTTSPAIYPRDPLPSARRRSSDRLA